MTTGVHRLLFLAVKKRMRPANSLRVGNLGVLPWTPRSTAVAIILERAASLRLIVMSALLMRIRSDTRTHLKPPVLCLFLRNRHFPTFFL